MASSLTNENLMRYLSFLAILFISISCQRKENDQDSQDLSYSVDTVIIDSKGRLLDLRRYILISDLDDEKNSIYLYNEFDHSVDEINLNNLKLNNNYSFETEGPNGTGESFNNFNLIRDSLFFIKSYYKSALFDRNGRLLYNVDWVNSIDSNGQKYGAYPKSEILVGSTDLKAFGLSYDYKNRDVFLDVLSVQDNYVNRLNLDSKKSFGDLILAIENSQIFLDPKVYLRSENDLVIISHEFSNEIVLFNNKGELVKSIDYEPKLTPKSVTVSKSANIASKEQLQEELRNYLEQVVFYPPVWDRTKQRYLRLSGIRTSQDKRPLDSIRSEVQEIKVYLSVFNTDFNLIAEVAIPELNTEFVKYFAKDGKLWVYHNFSDELGFIVIDI